LHETAEVLQDVDFAPLVADAEDMRARLDYVEKADEGAGESFDEVCDAAGTRYC
jgi:hypothetical protein